MSRRNRNTEPRESQTNAEDPKQSLTLNERLTVILKEYDALRKEAEQSIALMPDIGKSFGVVIAGALIAIKAELYVSGIAVCLPVVTMAVLAAFANVQGKLEATSRRMMGVEDRIFDLTKEELLVHETRMNIRRIGRGGRRWTVVGVVGIILYFALDAALFCHFSGLFRKGPDFAWWAGLYWTFAVAVGAYAIWASARIVHQRKHIEQTKLLKTLANRTKPASYQ
jgi:hypothetical protein